MFRNIGKNNQQRLWSVFQKLSGILPGETLKKDSNCTPLFVKGLGVLPFFTTWPKKRSPFVKALHGWPLVVVPFVKGLQEWWVKMPFVKGLHGWSVRVPFVKDLQGSAIFFAFCQGLGAIATFCQGSSSSFRISCTAVAKSAYQLFTFHLPLFLFRV